MRRYSPTHDRVVARRTISRTQRAFGGVSRRIFTQVDLGSDSSLGCHTRPTVHLSLCHGYSVSKLPVIDVADLIGVCDSSFTSHILFILVDMRVFDKLRIV